MIREFRLQFSAQTLAGALWDYGEDVLAERALALTEDALRDVWRIATEFDDPDYPLPVEGPAPRLTKAHVMAFAGVAYFDGEVRPLTRLRRRPQRGRPPAYSETFVPPPIVPADSTPLPSIFVVGAIFVRGRRILATQRGYGDYAGWWEFPGGKVEPGEEPEAALAREIREEMDTEIRIDRFYCITEYDYPKFHLRMRCYLCTLPGEEVTLLEHAGARWVGRADVFTLKWLGADLPVIHKLICDGVI
jgi:8-oxo-dGTP diphosphatase